MASHLRARAVSLAARSSPSPGTIAGAVVGSIIGAAVIAIVLFFLYFRYKRKLKSKAHSLDDEGDGPKTPEGERRLSFPGPDPSQVPQQGQMQHMPSWAGSDHYTQQQISSFGQDATSRQPPSDGTLVNQTGDFEPSQEPIPGSNFDYTSLQQPSLSKGQPAPTEYVPSPGGGNASYYDPNISMDSDPEQASVPPTSQMTELYEEQLQRARENRKNSKSSSIWSRLTGGRTKRKRDRVTEIAMEEGGRPDIMASIERDDTYGQDSSRPLVTEGGLTEEPQDMSDGSGMNAHATKKTKRRGPSGDANGSVSHRLDSMPIERQPTDPQLPSQALRQRPMPGDEPKHRQSTRFQSPALPEPMEMDNTDLPEGGVVRGSLSPSREEETIVNPMEVMKPSNAAEKAAFNDAELIRITSTSPPTSPPNSVSPPPMATPLHQDLLEPYDTNDEADESETSDDEEEMNGNGMIPAIEVPALSESSTPAAQSSVNPDSRTPDTRFTPSPSPVPSNGLLIADSSVSPADSSGSPKPVLRCDECDRTFDQIHKLNHHKRYHDRKHVCTYPDCGKKFGTKTHLDRHINDKHEKKKGFHCTQEGCQYFRGGKSFPRKDNWRRHMQNKHNIVPTFEPEPAE